jgi:phosphopantothenoylcysteine decarboxylase/phosphopantothenate--cysteine ligase
MLRDRGIKVVEPDTGSLASLDEWGVGRLVSPEELLAKCEAELASHANSSLAGVKVLVSAGGTREPIDDVRFIGNRSSGRMGYALAAQAKARGAEVTVISANTNLPEDPAITYIHVQNAAQLQAQCEKHFAACDLLLMAAAVSDYRPNKVVNGKLKRQSITLELEAVQDILAGLAKKRRDDQFIVGFAAESGVDAIKDARQKLIDKQLDLNVVNDISRSDIGFDQTFNEVTLLTTQEEKHVAKASKPKIAAAILDYIEQLRVFR